MIVSASICMPSITATEILLPQAEASDRGEQDAGDRIVGGAGIEGVDPRAPGVEPRQPVGERTSLVGDVVDCAAEGIDRIHGGAPVRRQHAHAAIERRAGGAHQPLDLGEVRAVGAKRRHGSRVHRRKARPASRLRSDIVPAQLHARGQRIAASQPSREAMREADDHRALQPEAAIPHPARQRLRLPVQRVAAVEQPVDHAPQPRRRRRKQDFGDVAPLGGEHVPRQIAAVERAQVLLQILQMVQHLERGAERVGGWMGLPALAMQGEHHSSDRVGGEAAVLRELVPARIAALGRVLAEGDEQVGRVARR